MTGTPEWDLNCVRSAEEGAGLGLLTYREEDAKKADVSSAGWACWSPSFSCPLLTSCQSSE